MTRPHLLKSTYRLAWFVIWKEETGKSRLRRFDNFAKASNFARAVWATRLS